MLGLWSKNILRAPSGLDCEFVVLSYDEAYKVDGTKSVALCTADLNNWSSANLNVPITWSHVCYFNNEFIAFGGDYVNENVSGKEWYITTAYLAYSKDGKTWNVQKYNNNATGSGTQFAKNTLGGATSSASNNGVLVVTGGEGAGIIWTTDGRNWTHFKHNGDSAMYGRDVIYAQNKFIRLGSGNLNWWSSDGKTWNTFSVGTSVLDANIIAFGNGVWLATNKKGQCIRSTNGKLWSVTNPMPIPTSGSVSELTFNNGVFLASCWVASFDSNGNVTSSTTHYYRSTDGINWTTYSRNGAYILQKTTHNNLFLSISSSSIIESSTDGATWTTIGKISGGVGDFTNLGKKGYPG